MKDEILKHLYDVKDAALAIRNHARRCNSEEPWQTSTTDHAGADADFFRSDAQP